MFDIKNFTMADNVFMTYNNVIQSVDMLILEFILKSKIEGLNIRPFESNSNANNLLKILQRKEVDIFNMISRDQKISDSVYYDYLSALPKEYNEDYVTDFIKGFNVYSKTKSSVNKLVVATGGNKIKEQIILDTLTGVNIEFVNDDDVTISEYIKNEDFKLIITDRDDLVNANIKSIEGKVICFPYVGYLFEEQLEASQNVMYSKYNFELKSFGGKFTVGYFEPFKITEQMFGLG